MRVDGVGCERAQAILVATLDQPEPQACALDAPPFPEGDELEAVGVHPLVQRRVLRFGGRDDHVVAELGLRRREPEHCVRDTAAAEEVRVPVDDPHHATATVAVRVRRHAMMPAVA